MMIPKAMKKGVTWWVHIHILDKKGVCHTWDEEGTDYSIIPLVFKDVLKFLIDKISGGR